MIGRRPSARPAAVGPKPEASAWAGRLRKAAGVLAIVVLAALAAATGLLRPLDNALAGMRFDLVRRPASQTLTVVEIDAASIRAAGRWPWGRERFARVVEALQDAGAESVAFDVDFSARSSPEADLALRRAIERRPGAVILPTFVQMLRRGGTETTIESSPLGDLSGQAVLASVNVPVDTDGRVRSYRYGFGEGEAHRSSVGALLGGAAYGRTDAFLIDYGIQPEEVPHLSFEDVHAGRFDPALVKGRKILIGSTALELGDEFATPKARALSGVYVHALAYESVRAGRDLRQLNPLLMIALAAWAAFLLRPRDTRNISLTLSRHAAVAVAAVGGPVVLQGLTPLSADTGAVLVVQALSLVWITREELARRARAIIAEREAGLLHLALHEPESELPNRRALLQEIARRVDGDASRPLAVLAVGIDRFATMRGAIGYRRFNEVVRQVAARIAEASGETLTAHLSTSVLGVAIMAETPEALAAKVNRIEAMDPWLAIEGLSVDAFVRIGVAYRAGPDDTAELLLENASIALDRGREMDRRVVTYDQGAFADPSLNLALMSDMVRGLEAGELALHYQPKLSIASERIIAVEALVRWTHPTRGPIQPDTLIATAEETGMIRAFTEWSVQQAVADLKRFAAAGHDLTMALNISASLLADRDFRKKLLREAAGWEGRLCLEITESAIIRNPGHAMAAIADYRAAGLKISIDDYGSGLSSLAYLKMIDADELKVDKALVVGLKDSPRDGLILKSTVDLAHSLGMSVVAEGVETEEVLVLLREMGCDIAQGWLISKALAPADLEALLTGRKEMRAA